MPISLPYRLAQLALCASACFAIPTPGGHLPSLQPNCNDIDINLRASAPNKIFTFNLTKYGTPEATTELLVSLGTAPTNVVNGNYRVAGRFCSPLRDVPERRQTLQILVHGLTYTKEYWNGPSTQASGPPATNQSWIYYAAEQGYSVLAVDRLCNGRSAHSNGNEECQRPLEAAILDKVVQTARNGTLPGLRTKFNKIIYVGHSYGSEIGSYIARTNPSVIDQLHLTGYSENILITSPAVILRPDLRLASKTSPSRFSNLDPGYTMETARNVSEKLYYSKAAVDPAVLNYTWATRGTVAIGELLTAGGGPAPQYNGDVFVINGDEDALFCPVDAASAVAIKPGACTATNATEDVAHDFPGARRFGYFNVPGTGHSIGLHKTTSLAIVASHQFMAETGF
ncbi:hypothetical protein ISF_00210 [Cordyceps fumosorosea ARSEF 2679]|uniref:AB hydrolase-1 domain-containing protein n=1 Tax=Cordyceps fumosorosea (strain ARSEF 2679) TaxID=1081104 RepID=A0A162N002_CORFA|nr:hypothetical protein ISF_00210 [Cordyceps fumosorosea ARSEF 2679]OAA73309.1 hypothetical protein ISF_00210 [Cordyceps fumosorosea ARSEF 2679]